MRHAAVGRVCVIIAAHNASKTITTAIASALREPEVAEVIVVDDASNDGTGASAITADDGSGRLEIIPVAENRGPAFARNRAIERSHSPFLAILDADDFFLPGRLANMLASDDWDLVADNVAFITEGFADATFDAPPFRADPTFMSLTEFVHGNIARRGARRGEMGFLKPVMRRAFLDEHRLRYREDMRLGEDYDLYVRALARGGRYKVLRTCGYGALVRSDSLSGKHRTEDLERASAADRDIIATEPGLTPVEADAVRRHQRHMQRRYELRRFLDLKARSGLRTAAYRSLARPDSLPGIAIDIALDKIEFARKRAGLHNDPEKTTGHPVRYLLPAVAEACG